MTSIRYWVFSVVLFMASTAAAKGYFLQQKSSLDRRLAGTALPGSNFTRSNLLRMVTHNALLDAFFLHQPLAPLERLGLDQESAREELQHLSLLELNKAVMLVNDIHEAKLPAYSSDISDAQVKEMLLRLNQTRAINDLVSASAAEARLAMIDFLLAKTSTGEEGSNFLPTILYASVVATMPPAVRNHELGTVFISTTDSWYVRDKYGKLIADAHDARKYENIDHAALAALPPAQLDTALQRVSQALQFIITQHTKAQQDSYWRSVTATVRQNYEKLASQEFPAQQRMLEKIKKIQADTNTERRKAAIVAFFLYYVEH